MGEQCSARTHINFLSLSPPLFHLPALLIKEQILPVKWLHKHYHLHATVLLLCINATRKLWQCLCMKHLHQLINVRAWQKNWITSMILNILKSALCLNSLTISCVIVTKHPNYRRCKVRYTCLLRVDLFQHQI